ncbi:MAG: nitrogen fixation protein [Thiothrix sp.]|nr:MAG: nitrogen fixation protein [Thiothrix sp.]
MKIGVTSQNFRTITGHAGKTRRFLVFESDDKQGAQETDRLDLPKEMSMHAFPQNEEHPLDQLDILITAGSGQGFVNKMAVRGVKVISTSETDPVRAVTALLSGESLSPADLHHH